jgi:hypothetical protein
MNRISYDELKQRLHYDPATGIFTWLTGQRRGKRAGGLGSNSRGHRYWVIKLRGPSLTSTPASHIAHCYMTGKWPDQEMDHINRLATDDRWQNLRSVTRAQNEWNKDKYRNNKSGIKGVYFHSLQKNWQTSIRRNGRRVYLGRFLTAQEAAAAYQEAATHD